MFLKPWLLFCSHHHHRNEIREESQSFKYAWQNISSLNAVIYCILACLSCGFYNSTNRMHNNANELIISHCYQLQLLCTGISNKHDHKSTRASTKAPRCLQLQRDLLHFDIIQGTRNNQGGKYMDAVNLTTNWWPTHGDNNGDDGTDTQQWHYIFPVPSQIALAWFFFQRRRYREGDWDFLLLKSQFLEWNKL